MVYERYCGHCGKHVTCKQERQNIEGAHTAIVRLNCPLCGRRLADIYDPVAV